MEFGFQVCGDAFRFPHETAVLLVKGVGGGVAVLAVLLHGCSCGGRVLHLIESLVPV